MARIRDQLDHEADGYGIQVVDVRIRRADLPEQNSQAVYQRMQTERQREAAEFRAQGGQKGRRSGPTPIAKRPSLSPKPIRPPSRSVAPATPSVTGCSPRPMARTPISSRSTAR